MEHLPQPILETVFITIAVVLVASANLEQWYQSSDL